MSFDSSGNLYVSDGLTVNEYAPGARTAGAKYIGIGTPAGIALDSGGNLYVASSNGNKVDAFAPGSTALSNTLTGLDSPRFLAFDSSGNLFVSNFNGNTVSEFAQKWSGKFAPHRDCESIDAQLYSRFRGSNR